MCILCLRHQRDEHAILANSGSNVDDATKRLSAFFHFDAPSILTIGENIAKVRHMHINLLLVFDTAR